ncbi:hypothetical protein T11_3547 [Trichinella zimbabwensis]|uniref:FLYWCH-type domain-containing protein n=1 Tax=Trichinella zimbabwensis TaxID=268475 RepID=A0A0V1HLI2_9BILA|nr:hypothetical protein T11_3547 [Trichinella zimbabwensis]
MADIPELRVVSNRCGGMSVVYEGRAYKLKYDGKRVKYWGCSKDKQGCKGAISTNLDVTIVLRQRPHMETCPVDEHVAYIMEKRAILKKRCAEETKSIPAIYDEEAAAASTEPSTSGHFPTFKRVRNAMYNQRKKTKPQSTGETLPLTSQKSSGPTNS